MSGEQWAVVEVMGHQLHAGRVWEGTLAGVAVLVVEQPAYERVVKEDEAWPSKRSRTRTERYPAETVELGGAAIFRRTLCSEEHARSKARHSTRLLPHEVTYGDWEEPAERPQLTGPVEEAEVVEDDFPFDDDGEE